ncbi:MAG TPA: RNA-binding protein [Xanthobacteraceae bacterium]|jgi:hypothetical protein
MRILAQTNDDVLDAGPRRPAPGAQRLCAATRKLKPVEAMVRFVVAPDGTVVPDLRRRLPGRGLWITGTRDVLAAGIERHVFAHGFKRDLRVTPELVGTTERLMAQAALDALAVARKAGKVVAGFDRVEAALADAALVALLHAVDGAPEGAAKLVAALRRRQRAGDVAVIRVFTSAQLDLALARPNVVHAALLGGPESDTFLARIARLDCFRAGPMSTSFGDGSGGHAQV